MSMSMLLKTEFIQRILVTNLRWTH